MSSEKSFFSEAETKKLVQAIADAEATTSGEIRVHIEPRCKAVTAMQRATEVFYHLKMNETLRQNGVLIYIAYKDHQFAIIGDSGIDAVVPAHFWEGTKEVMREHFKQGHFFDGVSFAICEVGFHLKQYFPMHKDDKNELNNEISEG